MPEYAITPVDSPPDEPPSPPAEPGPLTIGDALEVLAVAAGVAAAWLAVGLSLGLVVLAAGLAYLAQCHDRPLKREATE
jgi:hypothetical protein